MLKLYTQFLQNLSRYLELDLNYFIKGGFWLGLSLFLSTIGGIVLSVSFANLWPKDVYGEFNFLISALSLVSIISLPGMSQIVLQAAAENKDGTYKNALKLSLQWSLLGSVFLVAGAIYFHLRSNPNLALAVLLSALSFPLGFGLNLYSSFLNGKKEFKKSAIFNLVGQYISIVATLLALWKLNSLIWVAFFSAWSTAIINLILTLLSFGELRNNQTDKRLLRLGYHLSISQLLSISAEYLDRFLIPIILGFTNSAIYAIAILIPTQIHNFFKTFTTLGQPKIAEIKDKKIKATLLKKGLLLELLILVMVLLYIVACPSIFRSLYPQYQAAVFPSQIFSLSLLYYPANILGLGMVKKRASRALYLTNSIYVVSTFLALVVMLNLFGLLGAVLAKIATRFIYALCLFLFFNFDD